MALCLVPGHTGMGGNDKANLLSKKAAIALYVGPKLVCGIGETTQKGTE